MADDRNIRGPQDRSRVNLDQDYEVRYWTQELGCSEDELRAAVRKAGSSADAVRREIGKDSASRPTHGREPTTDR